MHIELLVEEPSAEVALQNVLPRILGDQASFHIHPSHDKLDLLDKLPARLSGYRAWLPADWRIAVLLDNDRDDCGQLKQRLEAHALRANLATKSSPRAGAFQVLNRIAIEELEAWFFGDIAAIVAAYPGGPPTLAARAPYRDPDSIKGGTWEALERVLQRAGYFPGGLAKIEAARAISSHMNPPLNRSKSFQVFRRALMEIAAGR